MTLFLRERAHPVHVINAGAAIFALLNEKANKVFLICTEQIHRQSIEELDQDKLPVY